MVFFLLPPLYICEEPIKASHFIKTNIHILSDKGTREKVEIFPEI